MQVHSEVYDAVSGKGTDPTGYWNVTRVFDFSKERQKQSNLGPTPEGLYSINKRDFVEGKNEGGFQSFSDLSWIEQAAASFGRSAWPGGTSSWGDYRWKLQFENVSTERKDFYLHGGSLWGSRGCIDLGAGINTFEKSFMTKQFGNDKVFLQVKYEANLKFEIQNAPTNQPMKFIKY